MFPQAKPNLFFDDFLRRSFVQFCMTFIVVADIMFGESKAFKFYSKSFSNYSVTWQKENRERRMSSSLQYSESKTVSCSFTAHSADVFERRRKITAKACVTEVRFKLKSSSNFCCLLVTVLLVKTYLSSGGTKI